MTTSILRTFSTVVLGVTVASLTVQALPVSADSFGLGAGGVASLGLPDRDVVRDPYSALLGKVGSFSVPEIHGVVAPNLGVGVSLAPGLNFGGGGGAPPGFGFSLPASTGLGIPKVASLPPSLPRALPTPGWTPSSTTTLKTSAAVVANVPEGGTSAILLGSGLLAIFVLRRRLARIKR